MSYSLFAADGTQIPTSYFTEAEPGGLVAIWFGAALDDPNREFIAWADTEAKAQQLVARLRQAQRLDEAYGVVIWKPEDVADKYGVSRQEATEYLETITGRLQDGQTEKGWDIIDFWRDEMPDARTPEQKAAWQKQQEDAEEQWQTSRYW